MIRFYQISDKNQLIELIRLNTPQYFSPKEEADLVFYLDNETEDYFVVEENKTIVGCGGINYSEEENAAVISWDIIHPDHQGKGIGRELLEYRINHIKKNNDYKTIVVRTSQLTDKFYNKLGFELEFIKKDYWAKDFDLYQMKLEL